MAERRPPPPIRLPRPRSAFQRYRSAARTPRLTCAPSPPRTDKDTYTALHSTGFREFLLKPELLRAIGDCGFEHPSEGNDTPPLI